MEKWVSLLSFFWVSGVLENPRDLSSPQKGSKSVTVFRSEASGSRRWVEEDGGARCMGSAQPRELHLLYESGSSRGAASPAPWRSPEVMKEGGSASTGGHSAEHPPEAPSCSRSERSRFPPPDARQGLTLNRKPRSLPGEPRPEKWETNSFAQGGECSRGAGVGAAGLIRMLPTMMMTMRRMLKSS